MKLCRRFRRSVLSDVDETDWPIPIWRPRTRPAVPLRKRLANLLLPKPSLEDLVPNAALIPYVSASQRRKRPRKQRSVPGLQVHIEEVPSEFGGNSPTLVSHTPEPVYSSTIPATSAFLSPPTVSSRKPSTYGSHSTRVSSRRQTSLGSSTVTSTISYAPTFGYPSPPTPPPSIRTRLLPLADRLAAQRQNLLHHLRVLHCLHLARGLLYAYNRLALSALATSSFPIDALVGWERDLDDWWVETTGVLNMSYKRVKATISVLEQSWEETIAEAHGDVRRERRRLAASWRREREVSGQGMPKWIGRIVPEPFGLDEVEEEVWALEEEGRVPTGTWKRMYGRPAGEGRDAGWVDVAFWDLSLEEAKEAEARGLRQIDLDERGRMSRARWRARLEEY